MSPGKDTIRRERTAFEWSILALSIAAIATIVAGLVVAAVGYESGPPALRVSVSPDDRPDRFTVAVHNEGGQTAEHVRVLVRRGRGSVEVELLAVPKGDTEEATVTIGGRGRPTAQVQSYQEP